MKTIKLKLLTQVQLQPITTNATIFAEFKNEAQVKELGIDWSSHKLIDRATRATLELDEAKMPEVDSIMFVTPTKTKSGMLSYKVAKELVKNHIDAGKIEKISWIGKTTEDLNKILQDIDVSSVEAIPEVTTDLNKSNLLVGSIQKLLKRVNKKVRKLAEVSGNDTSVLARELKDFKDNLAEFVTNDELTKELKDIQNRIK
jgi:hypothetical protein